MNLWEFIFGVVLVATIAGLIRLKMGIRKDWKGNEYTVGDRGRGEDDLVAELRALRREVKALKERQAVIERITVEKENSLEREIERLRDQ